MANDVKWIKITTDIFDDGKMISIESLPDGYLLEVVWFKILCFAGKCNQGGFLCMSDKVVYTDEILAKVFRIDVGVVQRALETFQKLGMIEIVDNTYMVSNWLIHQSGSKLEDMQANNRERQQRYRDKQKELRLEENRNVTDNVTDNVKNNVILSYSISKSNIFNLNYLLDSKEEYVYIKDNIELLEVLKEWLEYKDAKGKQHLHYAEISLEHLLKKFIDMNNKYGTTGVTKAVHEAIAQGWQGIVWEKAESKAQNTTKGYDWENI